MKTFAIASLVLIILPIAGMAATDPVTSLPGVPQIDQSRPGSTMSGKEEIAAKHLAAAAAHEQAAMHHKAAAEAMQSAQSKEHAKAAGKESSIACQKSTEALMSSIEK
ncbi:MAG: hypothetical protein PHF31_05220 [Methylobacter sp.]|nr:hypothetical protein [Methylobacter sp.]